MLTHGDTTHDAEDSSPAVRGQPQLLLLFAASTVLKHVVPLAVSASGLTLGRSAVQVHPIFAEDHRMSREHARVQWYPDSATVRLTDLKSRNGTFVNGVQVQDCTLREGDVVRLGSTLLLLRYASDRPARLSSAPIGGLLGESTAMVRLRETLSRVAQAQASVLLLGPTGTGKEVAARYIHDLSRRAQRFVAVNCTAIPESLAESQLFGHTRGAFTGASEHAGFFRAAQGGTLLLDEIGDLSEQIQPKLLRVLEERVVYPVGSVVGQPVDVRLLFATNRNLLGAVRAGRFRADLYSRIAEVVIELPPLCDRREDILALVLSRSKSTLPLGTGLAEALLLHDWPYNVRELVKLVAEIEATGDAAAIESRLRRMRVDAAPLGQQVEEAQPAGGTSHGTPSAVTPTSADRRPLKDQLDNLLRTHQGNIAAIARQLRCPRKYIYRWLSEYDLNLDAYRS